MLQKRQGAVPAFRDILKMSASIQWYPYANSVNHLN